MLTTVVYKDDELIGEVNVCLLNQKIDLMQRKIRITHFSQPSERCPPLAVLHAISPYGLCFKIESKRQSEESPISTLHSSCLEENKTAVMPLGEEEEVHLVAMHSRRNKSRIQCFWGFIAGSGLYKSCLAMLNLRCLGIVFDLDETLVVANTMRSFEDKIEALQRKINTDVDPQRISGMVAEVKRYQDDKIILKQYVENDQVVGNGKTFKIQSEVIPALSDNHPTVVRPLIRLHDKNIILTRINPLIRDTSVLVRLRPAWEDLRSYLTAKGRKRFEVYVCTMAERDYALEMWRLLDPDSNLIDSKEIPSRIVCVKSGMKKSLFDVFQDGICHPKMALVIDDRLKVWDEKDQPRVHVVPAFAPYYAPQAEANNAVPVLCVARNVACNARGGFFKEFDDNLLQRINGVYYEDDIRDIPSPDVSNYLVSEDCVSTNGNKDTPCHDILTDVDIERRLKDSTSSFTTISSAMTNLDPRLASSLQFPIVSSSQPSVSPLVNNSHVSPSTLYNKPVESMIQASPAREEGEVPESELDPDTRRRLLILQHGQDTRDHPLNEPPFPVRPPLPVSVPPKVSTHGSWFMAEEEMNQRQLNPSVSSIGGYPLDSDPMLISKPRPLHSSFYHGVKNSISMGRSLHDNKKLLKETVHRDDRLMRLNNSVFSSQYLSGEEEIPSGRASLNSKFGDDECAQGLPNTDNPATALQRIALKCSTKVEFRPTLVASNELQFFIEVWFADHKIGEGIGRTRREAQHRAAEGSLNNLAYKFLSNDNHDSCLMNGDLNRSASLKENGISSDISYSGIPLQSKEEPVAFSIAPDSSNPLDPRVDSSKRSKGSVSTLEELCMVEGLEVSFLDQSPVPSNSIRKDEVYAQVEINGQVVGKGIGLTWDEAKTHAAEKALGSLKSRVSQFSQKRPSSPRSVHGMSKKRLKPEIPRPLQRLPCSKISRNSSPGP